MSSVAVRKARIRDVPVIHKLLYGCAQKGLLLARSFNQLYGSLRDFYVADDPAGGVVGCCALTISWEDLGEIRSLVVDDGHQRRGLGRALAGACLAEARELGLSRVFALTYVTDFFRNLGFVEVEKEVLPQKIWTDCLNCPKFPQCDEIAMLRHLDAQEET